MTDFSQATEVAKALHADLNRFGHGFPHAIVRAASTLYAEKRSPWRLPVTEFPVEVKGLGTRVDIVFEHRHGGKYLVCECKRTNPKLSDWCFLKLPNFFNSYADLSLFDVVRRDGSEVKAALSESENRLGEMFHIAQEVKSHKKGDEAGRGRGVIEEAATQALRGVNGLVEFFRGEPQALEGQVATLMPVIFTTARLWVSKVDLSMSDLQTGNINTEEVELEEKAYLYYQYPQSPGLRHTVEYFKGRGEDASAWRRELGEVLYREYVRTIVVVSAAGVEEYLSSERFR